MHPTRFILNRRHFFCLSIFLVVSFLLCACKPEAQTETVQPTQVEAATPEITTTVLPELPSPTATSTLLPVTVQNSGATDAGLIIFSMPDGEFQHLFAYHPSYLSVTRLTSDAWDDVAPSVSPDGNKIAFASSRFGTRDVFILDLAANSLTQMTNSPAFERSIDWSPDGQYLVYDSYQNGYSDLIIQSVANPSEPLIQLTDGTSNNTQPSWSPDGSELAFVSDRSGQNEIWLARLQSTGDLFVHCIGDAHSSYSRPTWSPDGQYLAISQRATDDLILVMQPHNPDFKPVKLGYGTDPVWLPDGSGVLATLVLPNQTNVLAYALSDRHLMLPPLPMPGRITGYDWAAANLSQNVQTYLSRNNVSQPEPLWVDRSSSTVTQSGRRSLVELNNVDAPQAILSDAADDRFNQLRTLLKNKTGWDVLGILENAMLAPTDTSMPGIAENWLYTGRAFAMNLAPYEANWMMTSREEFAGKTYWRVWIKCKVQDGSCGEPLAGEFWNFNSRYSGDAVAYENGGDAVNAPAGYWVDFTELALRFGWERLPSLNNWRAYYPGIQFNVFVLRQGLSWEEALLDIYPPEQVVLIIEQNQ